jgi:hypothetical protein
MTLFNILITILVCFLIYNLRTLKETFMSTPKIKLAIHTVFLPKENNIFLEEWIDYHLNLGFDQIYLYNNHGSTGKGTAGVKDMIINKVNKYNIDYENLLIKQDINLQLQKLEQKYKNIVKIINWDYRDKNNNIVYGYAESIQHFMKHYSKLSDWTAFIDVDEFIYIDANNLTLKQYIQNYDNKNYNKLIIKQKKYSDRFCNLEKAITDIDDVIEINTDGWGSKNICKNIDLKPKQGSMHNIKVKNLKLNKCNVNELRFNHYNINTKQVDWMKSFFKTNKFNSNKDNTMKKYKTPLVENLVKNRKYNKQFYNDNKNKYCYKFK